MSDDITFCGSDCNNKKCFRHPSNIREPRIPHSFAYLKDTDDCPMKKKEVRSINANALKEKLDELHWTVENGFDKRVYLDDIIDSIPTVSTYNLEKHYFIEGFKAGCEHGKNCYERPQGEWVDEVWKLYEKYQPYLATRVIEFGDELKDLLGKYQKGGAE